MVYRLLGTYRHAAPAACTKAVLAVNVHEAPAVFLDNDQGILGTLLLA
ncbi:MAG: hypothetical protein PWQ52_929, partial [Methanolobus sp.]|nr:hypothetical protein [Methanolobus sp.]